MAEIDQHFVGHETEQITENSKPRQNEGPVAAGGGAEKKWPGWPGESVFRMLVPAQKVGAIIGRKGEFIKKIVEETRARVKILGDHCGTSERAVMVSGKEEPEPLPIFALRGDRVVEAVGDSTAVHKAIKLIALHLRKFLVDRCVLPIFEMNNKQMANPRGGHQVEQHMPPLHQSQGQPQGALANAGGETAPHMPPPQHLVSYYPPPAMPPPVVEKQLHQGVSYGTDALTGVNAPSNAQYPPSIVTQNTQRVQFSRSYLDAVIGYNGDNISYIRRASETNISIQETRGDPGEVTVEIIGTASGILTAQQLIQNVIAVAAPTQPQTLEPPANQQGYYGYGSGSGSANAGGGHSFGNTPHMPPPQHLVSYYPPPAMPPPVVEKQLHQGVSYGTDASTGVHAPANAQYPPSIVTQNTQRVQISRSYVDAVIGHNGDNISYIRQASETNISIRETRGVPGEVTVEIIGTASGILTAQQLIQNVITAAAPTQPQTLEPPANQQDYYGYGSGSGSGYDANSGTTTRFFYTFDRAAAQPPSSVPAADNVSGANPVQARNIDNIVELTP
ncbi:hypothetical protein RIF29_24243 [Crotalaria pallida]|uniref:K Homology domain-containing protein n=1 Tax=Crotalaria pallida TaxID=3830 RepID=A0AAN9ELU8_CROPI